MPLLRKACPSFPPGEEDDEGNLLFVDLGEFAGHVVHLYQQGQVRELPGVFAVVERLHLEGDEYVREAATIGLLEGIQNVAGHRGIDPAVFLPYLLQESAAWWHRLNSFWSGKAAGEKSTKVPGQVHSRQEDRKDANR